MELNFCEIKVQLSLFYSLQDQNIIIFYEVVLTVYAIALSTGEDIFELFEAANDFNQSYYFLMQMPLQ